MKPDLTRRSFLKAASLGMTGLAVQPIERYFALSRLIFQDEFPEGEHLGRVLEPQLEIKSRPDENSATVGTYEVDQVVVWLRIWTFFKRSARPIHL